MKRVAAFIDAGYLWVQVCTVLSGSYTSRGGVNIDYDALRIVMLDEIKSQFPDSDFLRVYWYDGPGSAGKSAEHVAIEKLDDFKLRLGTRNSLGTQKGVDGLIIADIISLTQQKAITHALLVTGDSDIAPGVIAAQGMGLRAHLLSIGPSVATSPYLAAEADFKRSWTQAEVSKFATAVAATILPPATVSPMPVTGSVPATAISAPVTIDFEAVAKSTYNFIKNGNSSAAATLSTLAKGTFQLPQDVDRAMLWSAAQQVGRALDPIETKTLRSHFRNLL